MAPAPRSPHVPSLRHARWLAPAAALAILLGACGGSSSSDGSSSSSADDTTTPTELASDPTGAGTGASTTAAAADATAICDAITQDDVAAILPEATLTKAAPNPAYSLPSCDYSIDLGGVTGYVVQIRQDATDGAYYDSQKEVQPDAEPVPGIDDAFAFSDFGTIVLKTGTGSYTVQRGVELTDGGQPASSDQMIAIAEQVADL